MRQGVAVVAGAALVLGLAALPAGADSTATAPGIVRSAPREPAKAVAPARAPAAKGQPAGPRVRAVTLDIRHRVFHQFVERRQVRLHEEFQVGDSPYRARVVEFVPDFSLDLETRKVFSRSPEPRNPAFRVIVREKGAPVDTVWAFLNTPPHFAKNSMLAFRVGRIEFDGRQAMTTADTAMFRRGRP